MRPAFGSPLPFADIGLGLLTVAAVYWLYEHARQTAAIETQAPGTWDFFSETAGDTADAVWTDAVDGVLSTVSNVTGELSRGLRNNNPGNIERDGDAWQGMAPEQKDPRYITFVSPAWGIRAMARIIDNYAKRGIKTVRQIVTAWAPPTENNTAAYIRNVARAVGGEDVIPTENIDTFAAALGAIIVQENSYNPYSHDEIVNGINMARGSVSV